MVIPPEYAEKFSRCVRDFEAKFEQLNSSERRHSCPGVLAHGDRFFDPTWFVANGFPRVTTFVQRPGDFIMTHPRGAHCVWSTPCVKESMAVASPGWVDFGVWSVDCNAP